jgi:DNA-binding NarL/FixJ family response regulator
MRIRVAVVEDDAFTLATLTAALKSVDVDVVISVNNIAEAIQLAKVRMPNVALLDLHLGKGPSGIDLAHALRKQNPTIGIVFLTSFDDPRLLLGQAPVFPSRHFYVRKQDIGDLTSLVKILQLAYLGKAGGANKSTGNPLAQLTDAQVEILRMVALGFSNAEIARQKFIQEKSVQVAINRLAKSLGLKSGPTQNQRVHIANKALSAGGYKY